MSDNLSAATANVRHRDRRHFVQAVFAEGLSAESAQTLRGLAQRQWQQRIATVVPELERLIEADHNLGRQTAHRARLGRFTYHAPMNEDGD